MNFRFLVAIGRDATSIKLWSVSYHKMIPIIRNIPTAALRLADIVLAMVLSRCCCSCLKVKMCVGEVVRKERVFDKRSRSRLRVKAWNSGQLENAHECIS